MKYYIFAFLWLAAACWMGCSSFMFAVSYVNTKSIVFAILCGILAVGFLATSLDRFIKAIAHSIYTVKYEEYTHAR